MMMVDNDNINTAMRMFKLAVNLLNKELDVNERQHMNKITDDNTIENSDFEVE